MHHQTRRTDATQLLQSIKRCVLSFLFLLPVSLLGLLLLLLLVYINGFSVFCVSVPFPLKSPSQLRDEPMGKASAFSSPPSKTKVPYSSSPLLFVIKEESPPAVLKGQSDLKPRPNVSSMPKIVSSVPVIRTNRRTQKKRVHAHESNTHYTKDPESRRFKRRVNEFLSNSSCENLLFFMTWISSIESFGDRELFAIESLFKSHPSGCLILVSNSLDSNKGRLVLKAFSTKGFKVIAIKPDYDYIFKDTSAETWLNGLKRGKFNPGAIPLEQNLSNLLRLVLLYKFGGAYLDTDVIILKSLSNLRNAIGAQAIDYRTRQWSRLNNAVLIFEKNHPLLKEFIDEFAITFNGNKWGHNGPYLVSRVVARIGLQNGSFNFTILPPSAFYPVDWNRIGGLYRAPLNEKEAKWVRNKLDHIRRHSLGVHLWNRESRKLSIEEGSIIHHVMSDCCIFCNSSFQPFSFVNNLINERRRVRS